MTLKHYKKSREDIARLQDLRRSSASARHKNKSKYQRKPKHKDRQWTDS